MIPSTVPDSASSASHGPLVDLHMLGSHPRPIESEPLAPSSKLGFHSPQGILVIFESRVIIQAVVMQEDFKHSRDSWKDPYRSQSAKVDPERRSGFTKQTTGIQWTAKTVEIDGHPVVGQENGWAAHKRCRTQSPPGLAEATRSSVDSVCTFLGKSLHPLAKISTCASIWTENVVPPLISKLRTTMANS